jgi:SAM-dependent methyltransferase
VCAPTCPEVPGIRRRAIATEPSWIRLGHPSYVWRFGQDRRLALVERLVPLRGRSILDVGCGIGTYVRRFRDFSPDVHGVDVDSDRIAAGSIALPNLRVARSEALPFPDGRFDVVFLNEVIEHVDDDRQTLAEAARVLRPGGAIVVFAPNRWFPFETHGVYIGRRFYFGNIPAIGYLPNMMRDRLAPHVRAYSHSGIERLFDGLPVVLQTHDYVYPGFDNFAARGRFLGALLRRIFYFAERTPMRRFGLSHLIVARRR